VLQCVKDVGSCNVRARYYSQFRAWAASSASRVRSSWLLASARVLERFCFFCALSCDWSLPPFDEAFARACQEITKRDSVSQRFKNFNWAEGWSAVFSHLGRLGSFSSRIARIARVVGTTTASVTASTAECSWRTADFLGNA
jgi:hypothetical protein